MLTSVVGAHDASHLRTRSKQFAIPVDPASQRCYFDSATGILGARILGWRAAIRRSISQRKGCAGGILGAQLGFRREFG